jgi:two-component system cell cycle sensor histidine kinase/response regulator CckA
VATINSIKIDLPTSSDRIVEEKLRLISLNDVVNNTIFMLKKTSTKKISLNLELDENLPLVKTDPQHIEQFIINIADNAVDALGEIGYISIVTKTVTIDRQHCHACGKYFSGEYALVSFKCIEKEVNPEIKAKIFEKLSTKQIDKNNGLGLSKLFEILSKYGGHFCCHRQEAVGTYLDIYLPLVERQVPKAQYAQRDPEQYLFTKETILMVDDEPALRDMAGRMLMMNGYQVLTAANGEEALQKYQDPQNKIKAVIMDLGMPGMGGKACLKEIHKIDPNVKVVIVSGYITSESIDELKDLGAWGMVAKPYRMADLLKSLCNTGSGLDLRHNHEPQRTDIV